MILAVAFTNVLQAGVNFIHILRALYMRQDPESAKKTVKLSIFFALSGSACTKGARRTLMKLAPGVFPIFFCKKLQIQTVCKKRKTVVKCWQN